MYAFAEVLSVIDMNSLYNLLSTGFASCEISGCGNLAIPILEKAITGPWFLELSTVVQAHPL